MDLIGAGVLDEGVARDVAAVLSPAVRRGPRLAGLGSLVSCLRYLVSGEVDSDRCDYLLRDSHFAGVTYGIYDLDRLQACELVLPGPDGPEIGLDLHGVHALEGLLLARYHMFHQVYFHKTPPPFEHYLEQALADGEIELRIGGLSDLVELRDDSVHARLHQARANGGVWSRRILDREPAKLVLRERVGLDQPENFLAQQVIDALKQGQLPRLHSPFQAGLHQAGRRRLSDRRRPPDVRAPRPRPPPDRTGRRAQRPARRVQPPDRSAPYLCAAR